ncbi:MAG: S8 family serine peptidase [Pseudobdellovibrionaceae bacterium]
MTKIFGAIVLLVTSLAEAGTVLRFQNGSIQAKTNVQATQLFGNFSDDYVLQFRQAITEKDKNELRSQGIQIFRYIPDDALIVRATAHQLQAYSQTGKINAFIPFKGSMKLSSSLPTLSVFSKGKTAPVAIMTFTADDAKSVLDFLKVQDSELQVLNLTGSVLSVKMSQILIPSLADLRGVEFVQQLEQMQPLHFEIQTDDENAETEETRPAGDYTDINGYETGTKVMNFEAIWAQGFIGKDQIVGMADTGLDTGDLSSISPDFKGAVTKGYSFGVGAKSWEDPMGHGTHVAGSVLSRGVTSQGKIKGGATGAQLVPQGMWSPLIDNLTVPPKLSQLFDAAYNDGARIHTNSWGAARNFGAYDAMAQQVDQFMWDHPDFLILFAAGNSGVDANKDGRIDADSIGSPGTAKNTLTVGASENLLAVGGIQKKVSELKSAAEVWPAEPIWSSKISDNVDGIAMFSSRGPTTDGRLKPEIVAPGTNILSNRAHTSTAEVLWGEYNADYVYSGGTSMATPLVAGAAAVVREVLIKKFKIANPSAALVKATLLHTAKDMYPGQYGAGPTQELKTRRPNSDEGYGRTDMAAVAGLTAGTQFVEGQVGQGEEAQFKVEVKSGRLLANLVYTDAPGSPTAQAALVNDLDLVVAKSGANQPAVEIHVASDSVNNHEIAELADLAPGSYLVTVRGQRVPMGKNGKQPFALVLTAP